MDKLYYFVPLSVDLLAVQVKYTDTIVTEEHTLLAHPLAIVKTIVHCNRHKLRLQVAIGLKFELFPQQLLPSIQQS